jgi:hypothetical protein
MTTEVNDANIAAAVASVDATISTTPSAEDSEPSSVKGMMSSLNKHSDGTNVIKESIKTFSNAFGSEKKGDILVPDKQEALVKLHEMVDADRKNAKLKSKKRIKWQFRTSPHEQFGKTLDDTFLAFIQWAKNSDKETLSYNVSKAFRRLTSFADWMEDSAEDLTEPLTPASVQVALKAWAMRCSIDKNGNFAWWIDFGQIDQEAIKTTVSPTDSLRAFVWYSHYVMYDENAQENGLVFIESVAKLGFIKSMTLVPMKVGAKLDRLTIGVLPVKMNAIYILETPTWMELFMKFMSMFMSKKMRDRMIILKDWNKIEEIVGKECIPKNFGKLEGSMEVDPVDAKYFS